MGLVIAAGAPPAHASILGYGFGFTQYYSQTSNSQPTSPYEDQADADLSTSLSTDLTGVSVTSSSPLSPMVMTGGGGNYQYHRTFGSQAAMDADFPDSTTYTFTISGGTLAGQSQSATTPSADAFSAVPFFTGSTFSSLQGANAASAINLTFNSLTPVEGHSIEAEVLVFQGSNFIWTSPNYFNSQTSSTIPANTLSPGTAYQIELYFFEGSGSPPGAEVDYASETLASFTTAAAPEPSSLALAGLGAALGLLARAIRARRTRC